MFEERKIENKFKTSIRTTDNQTALSKKVVLSGLSSLFEFGYFNSSAIAGDFCEVKGYICLKND